MKTIPKKILRSKDNSLKLQNLIILCVGLLIFIISINMVFLNGRSATTYLVVAKNEEKELVIDWDKTYGGVGNDVCYSAIETVDEGFALAGVTNSYSVGGGDIWLVKTDSSGIVQWNQTFGGVNNEVNTGIIQTVDQGYALVGTTNSYGAGLDDIWLVKTDTNGIAQWNQTFGGANNEEGWDIVQTTDGGFVITGWTQSFGAGKSDIWVVKTDADGLVSWNHTYGGEEIEGGFHIFPTSDSGFVISGSTSSTETLSSDLYLCKISSTGILTWNYTYGGSENEFFWTATATSDGGYLLAGSTDSSGAGGGDIWLVKTDADGIAQWNRTIGGTRQDFPLNVLQMSDGGYVVAGETFSFGAGGGDIWLVKTDANGITQWDQTFGGSLGDSVARVFVTSTGDFVLAGRTFSYGAGSQDMWLIKTKYAQPETTSDISLLPVIAIFIVLSIRSKGKKTG